MGSYLIKFPIVSVVEIGVNKFAALVKGENIIYVIDIQKSTIDRILNLKGDYNPLQISPLYYFQSTSIANTQDDIQYLLLRDE